MGQTYEAISPDLAAWLAQQRVFFVATAPPDAQGLINCSPKGADVLRVLGPNEVAYLDLTGSGIETVAHLRENGRIVLMFCAFEGPPKIVRLHGTGEALLPSSPEYQHLQPQFPQLPGARSIIRVRVQRVSSSCGFAVPFMAYQGERETLLKLSETKGEEGLRQYRAEKNAKSIEGLPGLDVEASA